ncbi:MAG TPA: V-type ATP synthase subunit B [Spirochaetia bacterium]|nr:V-type ATP synthase subunit B [Spirochaetia bacterium]
MSLLTHEYRGVRRVSGPLLFVESASDLPYNGTVSITSRGGAPRHGQVIEVSDDMTVVQVFEDTMGLDVADTSISLVDREARLGVSEDLIGRILDGSGRPRDGLPPLLADELRPVSGVPINPISREKPRSFIHTGVSAIDGFNTLVRGQKLPVFSGAGLPGNEIAAQVLRQSRVTGESETFLIVFAAIGITQREAAYFLSEFERTGARSRAVTFLNLADDPTIERLLTPRCALTAAEYLAFDRGYEVLVLMTDMTSYCEALREIGTAREEIPGRRGYPGYMYTDLASLYERAGRIRNRRGSVTLLPILTMPDDDITHPIPDLTGYITEGQIVLSRQLHRRGVFPPIDVLRSLSRLMNNGIGRDRTREDHRELSNQLYSSYAKGQDTRRLVAIVGEDALSDLDRKYLHFADEFERTLIHQGGSERPVEETLRRGWQILGALPEAELRRIRREFIQRYRPTPPEAAPAEGAGEAPAASPEADGPAPAPADGT